MIVVVHTDMSVRGWVGSVDLNDDSRFGHVDMVTAIRSPGSVLKPFVYGLALDDVIHPASLLQDVSRRTGVTARKLRQRISRPGQHERRWYAR